MSDSYLTLLIIISFLLGSTFKSRLDKYLLKVSLKKNSTYLNSQFNEILKNIQSGKSKFSSRVNSTVFIDTKLVDWHDVNLVYLIDTQMVYIFKDNKCLYSCENLDLDVKNSIIDSINKYFNSDINDVVEVLGVVMSKKELDNRIDEMKKQTPEELFSELEPMSDIDRLIEENSNRFDMDDILDKISKIGFEKLSNEEKEFLNNYNV